MIALLLILCPASLAETIPEPVRAANEAACAEPHYESALRTLYASFERIEQGDLSNPLDVMNSMLFRCVVTMGPAFANSLVQFQKPKVKGSGGASEIPSWEDVARRAISGVCEEATYGAIRSIFERLASGELKSQGFPSTIDIAGSTPEQLFFEVIKAQGSPNSSYSVSEREFDGLSEDMKGAKCRVTWGYFAGSWRVKSKGQKEAEAAAKAKKLAAAAPAPEAGA